MELALATPGVEATTVALTLPHDLSFDEWMEIGRPVLRVAGSCMWWAGDWLLYGFKVFGTDAEGNSISSERARILRALAEVTNVAASTLRDAVATARAFDPGRRRSDLTYTHHRVVAACDMADADELLAAAVANAWTKDELLAERRRREAVQRAADLAPEVADDGAVDREGTPNTDDRDAPTARPRRLTPGGTVSQPTVPTACAIVRITVPVEHGATLSAVVAPHVEQIVAELEAKGIEVNATIR